MYDHPFKESKRAVANSVYERGNLFHTPLAGNWWTSLLSSEITEIASSSTCEPSGLITSPLSGSSTEANKTYEKEREGKSVKLGKTDKTSK